MFNRPQRGGPAPRRGIVLILILGMLGLMALIGVTFATFANQSRIGARNFSRSIDRPDAEQVMDFALSQLINDTNNVNSALRGHSLLRDMYGNDSLMHAQTGQISCYLDQEPVNNDPLRFTNYTVNPTNGNYNLRTNLSLQYTTGVRFDGWIVRMAANPPDVTNGVPAHVAQTFEILADDRSNGDNSGMHVFVVAGRDVVDNTDNVPPGSRWLNSNYGNYGDQAPNTVPATPADPTRVFLAPPFPAGTAQGTAYTSRPFSIDGRLMRAFDGAGVGGFNHYYDPSTPIAAGKYPNYRLNGNLLDTSNTNLPGIPAIGNPNAIGLDEDYDACDLENWFLALQSADGKVMIPSFHRPGIIRADANIDDWTNIASAESAARFLRPRRVDHPRGNFPDLRPDPVTGLIDYDVDNDGDGVTDSVWLDLGFPTVQGAGGQAYKPLFAFMVLGLNGRLPLNTVGNLQERDPQEYNPPGTPPVKVPANMPGWKHASHLGFSVNEINPEFALQNSVDAGYSQVDDAFSYNAVRPATPNSINGVPVWITQLRNLLAGARPHANPTNPVVWGASNSDYNFVYVANQRYYLPNGLYDNGDTSYAGTPKPTSVANELNPPVPGRWGEPESIPTIIPNNHRFLGAGSSPVSNDIAEPNYPLYLNYNNPVRAGRSGYLRDETDDDLDSYDIYPSYNGGPESFNFYDLAGAIALPSERIRRYVTPIDPAGVGRLTTFQLPRNPMPALTVYDEGRGADVFGRVDHYRHFRPPGMPGKVTYPHPQVAPNFDKYKKPWIGTPTTPTPPSSIGDLTNNTYHGFEAARFGAGRLAGISGSMPYDIRPDPSPPGGPLANWPTNNPPLSPASPSLINRGMTFGDYLAEELAISTTSYINKNQFPIGSLNRDEADEMNLYDNNPYDMPYGPGDLEWLYRLQDVDGAALTSRLGKLAPISFLNPSDGQTRRRLFSTDSWELNRFVWTNDNPVHDTFSNDFNFGDFPFANNRSTPTYGFASTPQLAHRDRKINLNYPLPVSNDPTEPVRLKWIGDAYRMLKSILPPRAVDTPEELAELSQYVVNIIDFRDPDASMTQFINPDLEFVPATATAPSNPSKVIFSSSGTTNFLVQFGMEYNPIAINEVLAYQFVNTKSGTIPVKRMFVELVNTLKDPNPPGMPLARNNASRLDLAGWEFMILPEEGTGTGIDYTNMPDPVTGQVAKMNDTARPADEQPQSISGNDTDKSLAPNGSVTTDLRIRPLRNDPNPDPVTGAVPYYYVFGHNPDPATFVEATDEEHKEMDGTAAGATVATLRSITALNPKLINSQLLPTPAADSGESKYFWLYLIRPANPFDANFPTAIANPANTGKRVVVDSMRFSFSDPGRVAASPQKFNYSSQRLQPYRGGHLVTEEAATLPAKPRPSPRFPYGFSEQTSHAPESLTTPVGKYLQTVGKHRDDSTLRATKEIWHTIGRPNNPSDKVWDYLPFHDRDFTGVAELLMVPGCPPGLFTKKFVEHAGPTPASTTMTDHEMPTAYADPYNGDLATYPVERAGKRFTGPWDPPVAPDTFPPVTPVRTFPYLMDKFYYKAASDTSHPAGTIDGYTSAGWSKMFDFFEVPSSAAGSLGMVQDGENFDWARQDRKPGLLNLNLIIDQEVFLGLLDDDRLSYVPVSVANSGPTAIAPEATIVPPKIVNQVNSYGYPNAGFELAARPFFRPSKDPRVTGYTSQDTSIIYLRGVQNGTDGLTTAFSDFLKLRHGGSGFMFGFGNGPTGSGPAFYPNNDPGAAVVPTSTLHPQRWPLNTDTVSFTAMTYQQPAAERPFRSPSFPDINQTVMRPATLPPESGSATTNPQPATVPRFTAPPRQLNQPDVTVAPPAPGYRVADPGLKNPNLAQAIFPANTAAGYDPFLVGTGNENPARPVPTLVGPRRNTATLDVPQPPPVPPRRLFQPPDAGPNRVEPVGTGRLAYRSNASQYGQWQVNQPIDHPNLSDRSANLFRKGDYGDPDTNFLGSYAPVPNTNLAGTPPQYDLKAHPYYRTEVLQKVMNLTTVRTHQFAVWITVGFFEVRVQGNPQKGQPDELGVEIGLAAGKNIRFRSFFTLDRTNAVGFSNTSPADFRKVVTYRRRIE